MMEMFEEIEQIYKRYGRVREMLTFEEVTSDKKLFLRLTKEQLKYEKICLLYEEYLRAKKDLVEGAEILTQNPSDAKLLEEEIEIIKKRISRIEDDLKKEYAFFDAKFEKLIIEVDEQGGELAKSLKEEIENDIIHRAFGCGFECEKLGELIYISGLNVKSTFDSYIGCHFVKRGILSGKCAVYVLENDEKNDIFDLKDVKIETLRSSGAGGQHINTTDSAVRVTHLPTGISVKNGEERSQIQNKEEAIRRLKERVENYYLCAKEKSLQEKKKTQQKRAGFCVCKIHE